MKIKYYKLILFESKLISLSNDTKISFLDMTDYEIRVLKIYNFLQSCRFPASPVEHVMGVNTVTVLSIASRIKNILNLEFPKQFFLLFSSKMFKVIITTKNLDYLKNGGIYLR